MGKTTIQIGPHGDRFDAEMFDTIRIVHPRGCGVPGERVWTIEVTNRGGLEIRLSDRGGRIERVVIQPESANVLRLIGTELRGIA